MLKPSLLFLAILVTCISCQKTGLDWDDVPSTDSSSCKLVRVVQGIHNGAIDDDTVYNFSYDASGKINRFVDSGSTGLDYTYDVKYDGQGRIVEVHCDLDPADSLRCIYNSQGKIAELYWRDYKTVFEYAGSDLPRRAILYEPSFSGGPGWEQTWVSDFTFLNGNLVSESISRNNVNEGSYTNTFYENMVNPLSQNIRVMNYALTLYVLPKGYEALFSKNLIKTSLSDDGQISEFWNFKMEKDLIKEIYGDPDRMPDGTFQPRVSRFLQYECK
jgi:hypothetical protein